MNYISSCFYLDTAGRREFDQDSLREKCLDPRTASFESKEKRCQTIFRQKFTTNRWNFQVLLRREMAGVSIIGNDDGRHHYLQAEEDVVTGTEKNNLP